MKQPDRPSNIACFARLFYTIAGIKTSKINQQNIIYIAYSVHSVHLKIDLVVMTNGRKVQIHSSVAFIKSFILHPQKENKSKTVN